MAGRKSRPKNTTGLPKANEMNVPRSMLSDAVYGVSKRAYMGTRTSERGKETPTPRIGNKGTILDIA